MKNENNDSRIYTLESEKPSKAVLKMGIPVAMGMMFMVFYNLVDTYFIGRLHNDYQLSAVNLSYPIMMIMVAIAGITGNGAASYMARCMGAKKTEEAEHTLTIGFELIAISAFIITALGLIFINPIVDILGASELSFQYTKDYTQVIFIGSIFTMGNYAIGQLLRSEGSAFYSMIGMIAGTLANIILDPIFIFALGMEIKGAAIATILGNAIGMGIFIFYYCTGKTILKPRLNLCKFNAKIFGEIMLVGIPHTLEQLLTTAAMVVNNNLASKYSDIYVAAMGIANKIMSFGNYTYQGLAAGCQPLMGYNYGAKNYTRLKQLIKSAVAVTTAIEVGILAIFGIFATQLISIFSKTPEVITIGTMTLRAFMLILPFVGTVAIVRNTFNAIGKPGFAFGITIVRQLVLYIPFLIIFEKLWGYTGLIYAQPVEEFICSVFAMLLLFAFLKRERNRL